MSWLLQQTELSGTYKLITPLIKKTHINSNISALLGRFWNALRNNVKNLFLNSFFETNCSIDPIRGNDFPITTASPLNAWELECYPQI